MRETYTDDAGVVRYADSGRKVRSDKGTRKPHPPGCRHCEMVTEYRLARQAQIDAIDNHGGWRDICTGLRGENPYSHVWTFREWLCVYRYESPDDYGIAA